MFSAKIWITEIIAGNVKDEAKIRLLAVFNKCVITVTITASTECAITSRITIL